MSGLGFTPALCMAIVAGNARDERAAQAPSVADILAARQKKAEDGRWVPACGGTEVPFRTRSGRTLLYCWQPSTGRHAYLDCGTDLILSDADAAAFLATGGAS